MTEYDDNNHQEKMNPEDKSQNQKFRREASTKSTPPDPDRSVTDSDSEHETSSVPSDVLPLYEAKLIHQYDHRFATYGADGKVRDVTRDEHANQNFVITPRYWVDRHEVDRAADSDETWFLGFRDITNSTNARTVIASFIPRAAVGHSLPLLRFESLGHNPHALGANLNSLIFDYVARQKVGGTHLTFFILKQLPLLPPDTYTDDLLELITPRVLELTYTAHDMAPFARDLGYDGDPFIWDEDRRAQLRADLDGIYAHLYGISRDDFDYILETFPIVKRKDEAEHGEYRTKRLCLEAYDRFENHPAVVAAKPGVDAT